MWSPMPCLVRSAVTVSGIGSDREALQHSEDGDAGGAAALWVDVSDVSGDVRSGEHSDRCARVERGCGATVGGACGGWSRGGGDASTDRGLLMDDGASACAAALLLLLLVAGLIAGIGYGWDGAL